MTLTEKNLILYAAQHYYNPRCIDSEEFFGDLKRFKYIKRLLNKYKATGELSERLILNHLIVIFNVFGIEAGVEILALKIEISHWETLRPFLIFLNATTNTDLVGITLDPVAVEALRAIRHTQ
jgi:hypothetical protein